MNLARVFRKAKEILAHGRKRRDRSGGGASLLATGMYWASGNVSLAPTAGNYTPSSLLNDNAAGDTATGETSTGAIITVVAVLAAPISIASWAQTWKYNGLPAGTAWAYWDGSAWQAMSDTNAAPYTIHGAYGFDSRTATFSGVPSASIFRSVITTSSTVGGNLGTYDSRPA